MREGGRNCGLHEEASILRSSLGSHAWSTLMCIYRSIWCIEHCLVTHHSWFLIYFSAERLHSWTSCRFSLYPLLWYCEEQLNVDTCGAESWKHEWSRAYSPHQRPINNGHRGCYLRSDTLWRRHKINHSIRQRMPHFLTTSALHLCCQSRRK